MKNTFDFICVLTIVWFMYLTITIIFVFNINQQRDNAYVESRREFNEYVNRER